MVSARETPKQGDVYLVPLDPTIGREMQTSRPRVVVSPDRMNRQMGTVLIVPLTSSRMVFPFRVASSFAGVEGEATVDQLRTVDRGRLLRRPGVL